jgi:hypothetical protein
MEYQGQYMFNEVLEDDGMGPGEPVQQAVAAGGGGGGMDVE